MTQALRGKRVAILATEGFEQVELTGPREALEKAGAQADIVSAESGTIRGWNHIEPADEFTVDHTFDSIRMDDYDAVLLPGGVVNSDTIRTNELAQELVRDAARANKPIAVICHGGWLLISRSEEHTSELQSRPHLVCRLLLEKKKNNGVF